MVLYLKKVNTEDIDEQYKAIKSIPEKENGFENKFYNVTKEEFINQVIPKLLNNSEGKGLPEGYVPDTYFFLWDDDKIVGLFKIRHYLNEKLRNGAGHIGYGILPEERKKGYGKKGLLLAIDKCKEIIEEDEIYLSVHKNNPTSLKIQLECGAYIVGETEDEYLTRIKFEDRNVTLGIKDLKRNWWKRLIKKETEVHEEKNDYFDGYVCYLKINEVKEPLIVNSPMGHITIADKNYKNIMIAPKNKNWWLTVMFDDKDNIIESYFDITKVNNFNNTENPYFVDMKLDICIVDGYEPILLDEDELEEVYNKGLITKEDYDNAYKVANEIIKMYNLHKDAYYEYIYNLYRSFNKS